MKTASRQVGAYEAKTHLSSLLKEVAAGKEVVITRRERPIAKLVPIEYPRSNKEIVERIRALRGVLKLKKGETVKDLINAGRRI
jgi:prevent-host-death family protein